LENYWMKLNIEDAYVIACTLGWGTDSNDVRLGGYRRSPVIVMKAPLLPMVSQLEEERKEFKENNAQ